MAYMNDTMRVELSLPVHIMLTVRLAGANCAGPATIPTDQSEDRIQKWHEDWKCFNERPEDPAFVKFLETFRSIQ
jgi:hypothetical protein